MGYWLFSTVWKKSTTCGSVCSISRPRKRWMRRSRLPEPSARGMGIGRRLVEECVKFAKAAGYKTIELWTQSELTAARHIYKQVGFECVGKKRHHSWGRKQLVSEVWQRDLQDPLIEGRCPILTSDLAVGRDETPHA